MRSAIIAALVVVALYLYRNELGLVPAPTPQPSPEPEGGQGPAPLPAPTPSHSNSNTNPTAFDLGNPLFVWDRQSKEIHVPWTWLTPELISGQAPADAALNWIKRYYNELVTGPLGIKNYPKSWQRIGADAAFFRPLFVYFTYLYKTDQDMGFPMMRAASEQAYKLFGANLADIIRAFIDRTS